MRWLARAMGGPRLRLAEAMLMMPMLIWVAVTPTSEAEFAPEAGAWPLGTFGFGRFGAPGGGGTPAPGLALVAGFAPGALLAPPAPVELPGAAALLFPVAGFCTAAPLLFCCVPLLFGALPIDWLEP